VKIRVKRPLPQMYDMTQVIHAVAKKNGWDPHRDAVSAHLSLGAGQFTPVARELYLAGFDAALRALEGK
jgi:hypothetical protein